MATQEEIHEALKEIEDPEPTMGIVDLGLVYGIEIDGPKNENVIVTMTLTSPMCPIGPMFKEAVVSRVRSREGVESAAVEITSRRRGIRARWRATMRKSTSAFGSPYAWRAQERASRRTPETSSYRPSESHAHIVPNRSE